MPEHTSVVGRGESVAMDTPQWERSYVAVVKSDRMRLPEAHDQSTASIGRRAFEAGASLQDLVGAHMTCLEDVVSGGQRDFGTLERSTVPLAELLKGYEAAMRARHSACPTRVNDVIRERERMEVSLHESEERYRTLFEQAADSIVLLDVQSAAIVEFNERAHQNLGYTRDEFHHLTLADIEAVDSPEEIARRLEDVFRKGADTFETKHRTKNGQIRDVLINARTIYLDGRKRVQGIWRDITERKRTEELARKRQQELAHVTRLSTVGEMAAGLAHEINQPLFAITNYAEGCLRKLHSGALASEDLVSALQQIAEQGQRAGEIIRRLRRFVRSGEPKWEIMFVNDLVEQVRRFVEGDAHAHGVHIDVHLTGEPRVVEVDSIQMQQVLVNLVRNGIEAMPDAASGSRVLTIRTLPTKDETVEVTVSDTGQGISTDTAEEIFDPFFSTKSGGLGMGLSISRTIVEAHGGRVWATPNPDRGTTFHLTLPFAKDQGP